MLEYHLYNKQMNEKKAISTNKADKSFKDTIESFISKYDKHIEPRYILFLF